MKQVVNDIERTVTNLEKLINNLKKLHGHQKIKLFQKINIYRLYI